MYINPFVVANVFANSLCLRHSPHLVEVDDLHGDSPYHVFRLYGLDYFSHGSFQAGEIDYNDLPLTVFIVLFPLLLTDLPDPSDPPFPGR